MIVIEAAISAPARARAAPPTTTATDPESPAREKVDSAATNRARAITAPITPLPCQISRSVTSTRVPACPTGSRTPTGSPGPPGTGGVVGLLGVTVDRATPFVWQSDITSIVPSGRHTSLSGPSGGLGTVAVGGEPRRWVPRVVGKVCTRDRTSRGAVGDAGAGPYPRRAGGGPLAAARPDRGRHDHGGPARGARHALPAGARAVRLRDRHDLPQPAPVRSR